MVVTILGSGTSTGVPMVGCSCRVCSSSDPKDQRTRASLLITTRLGERILVDTSTDLRRQALREKIPHIDAVLFTHPHADHLHGIDDLRGFHFIHKRVLPCYADQETLATITRTFGYIFTGHEVGGYSPLLEARVIHGPFTLFGLTVVPITLLHGPFHSTGYRIGPFAYLTDLSRIPESSLAKLHNLDTLVIDALRYTPHESHLNIEGALKVVAELKPRQAIFTHLTHEVAHGDGIKLPFGVEFAYDGMRIEFSP
ncbi:MAG TPA: GPMC system MBL fold metallohydrolase [Geobacterales bacterium]|nr:GPMC system MBL fold metallohydrolase [Geobacterales bacterium]